MLLFPGAAMKRPTREERRKLALREVAAPSDGLAQAIDARTPPLGNCSPYPNDDLVQTPKPMASLVDFTAARLAPQEGPQLRDISKPDDAPPAPALALVRGLAGTADAPREEPAPGRPRHKAASDYVELHAQSAFSF